MLSIEDEHKFRQVGVGMTTPLATSIKAIQDSHDAHLAELGRSHALALELQERKLRDEFAQSSGKIVPGGPGSLKDYMTDGEKLEGRIWKIWDGGHAVTHVP